jgi:hypothetical protein
MGDSIVNSYNAAEQKINGFNLPAAEKEAAIKKISALTQEELRTQANNPSWIVTGRARYNVSKGIKGAEKVARLRAEINALVFELEGKASKNNVREEDQRLIAAIKEAEEKGLKVLVFEGKSFKKARKWWKLCHS